MSDSDILKQIALLNPRIINGNEVDANDFIMQSDTSSPIEENTGPQIMENDDDDILNLWSSTKIFFDPFDPSKISKVFLLLLLYMKMNIYIYKIIKS